MTAEDVALEFESATQPWQWQASPKLMLRGRQWHTEGTALVNFIHGNGFCAGTYWPFLRELRGQCSALLPEMQGHGASDAGTRYPGAKATALRALQALAHYPPAREQACIGMAHSFGGYISLLMAVAEPARFSQLILLDPIFIPPAMLLAMRAWPPLNPMIKRARTRRSVWPSRTAAHAALYGRGIFRSLPDAAFECYLHYGLKPRSDGQVMLCCPPWMEAEIFARPPLNTWQAITQLKIPTQIFYGKDSYPFMQPGMLRAARKNPLIQVQELPGGHCFMLEHPETVAKQVLRAMNKSAE